MKIIETIFGKAGYVKAERVRELGPIIGSYLSGFGTGRIIPEKSYSQLVDAYKSWVYTCIDKIAKSVAMVPLRLYVYREKKTGRKVDGLSWRGEYKRLGRKDQTYFLKEAGMAKEEVYIHAFLDLMQKPNGLMTRFMLWYETMLRMELGGMCGWLLTPNALGLPGQIVPLPLTRNATLKPIVKSTMILERWEYQDGDVNQSFLPDDILLMKYPHPASPFHAMSPLMAQTYPYDIDLFLMQQQRALFDNMALPGLHLTTDQQLKKAQVTELQEMIDAQFATSVKAGKTLVTHSGLKAIPLGQSAREAMIDSVARFAREKLITSFDLSEGKVGLVRDVNRANMEALNETYINECLRPKCMMIEEVIEAFLLPRYDSGLTCDFELPDIGQKELEILERKSNLETFLTSINEEREWMGLEPVAWGNLPWGPIMVQQLTATEVMPPTEKAKGIGKKALTPDSWTEKRKSLTWKLFVARSEVYEQRLVGPFRAYFKSVEYETLQKLEELGKRLTGQYMGWSRPRILAHWKENKDAKGINIVKAKEKVKLRALTIPLLKAIMQEVGDDRITNLRESIKFALTFNLNDPEVEKWLGSRMRIFSEEVTNTTFDEIEAILREGFAAGEPVTSIAETLRQKFESWDQYRAPLMARTETIASMNKADLEAISQTGLEEDLNKHWLTAGDEAVRETHQKAGLDYIDGIAIEEEFVVGGDRMDSPGNGKLAEENINCRCALYYTEKPTD